MAANWPQIQAALVLWATETLELPAGQVLLSDQNAKRPSDPFVQLRISNLVDVFTEVDTKPVPLIEGPPEGEEMETTASTTVEFTVTAQVIGGDTVGVDASYGRACRLRTALSLPKWVERFEAAGFTFFDLSPVANLSKVVATRFEARALFEIRCYVMETASQTGTVISSAQIDGLTKASAEDEGTELFVETPEG